MKRLTATQPGEEPGRFDEAWGGIAFAFRGAATVVDRLHTPWHPAH